MKYENKDIELIVHIRNGKYYKLRDVVSQITWSGDIKSPSRTLEFDFIQAVNDIKVRSIGLVAGSTVCFYVGGKEIFRGAVIDISKSSSDNSVRVIANDIGFLLAKDEVSYNFVDKTACDIAKEVLAGKKGQIKLKQGKIAVAGTRITKIFIAKTRYDVIMSVYTEHSKKSKDHKKYMVEVDIDKFNVIEKGIVKLKVEFQENKNVERGTYRESINELVNRVIIVDEQGNQIKDQVDKELVKLYKPIAKVLEQKKDKAISPEEIKSAFKGLERTCSIVGYGNIDCKCGYKIQVKDSYSGLVGEFYIDKDKHTWAGGEYKVELELNFDNIMDEHDDGQKEDKNSDMGTSGAGDWGHGITEDMLNKILKGELAGQAATIIKWCNAFKINPLYFAIQAKIECGSNFDSYNARVRNNFGGIKADPEFPNMGQYVKYPSKEKGIERMCRLISVVYLNQRNIRSVDRIIAKWAPTSDGNNVGNYISMMKNTYAQVTGKTWDDSMLGPGVKSVEDAYRNLNSGSNISGTGAQAGKIVQVAQKYLTNGIKKPGFWWCCWFVNKCIKEAGMTPPPATNPNLCDSYYDAYQKVGKLMNPQTYIPKPGDAIFFYGSGGGNRKRTNHIGIVSHVSGSGNGIKIHTIEGNADNAVKSRTYGRSGARWARIVGYGVN